MASKRKTWLSTKRMQKLVSSLHVCFPFIDHELQHMFWLFVLLYSGCFIIGFKSLHRSSFPLSSLMPWWTTRKVISSLIAVQRIWKTIWATSSDDSIHKNAKYMKVSNNSKCHLRTVSFRKYHSTKSPQHFLKKIQPPSISVSPSPPQISPR